MLRKESEQRQEIIIDLHDAKSKVSSDAHELDYLRKTRIELTQEREDLINDLIGHQAEIENMYKTNRDLKNKIKRLEAILYGRKHK
jgi:septal ring factor EnvC (AmiA/AmiB activator)